MSPAATMSATQGERAILSCADRLFYAHGIEGVSMADVRDGAGVSLRRLYGLHASKADLVAAWLEDRHARWMSWFRDAVDRQRSAGSDGLLATFDAIEEWAASPGYRGCAFINTLAEPSEVDERHREIVVRHKRAIVDLLTELATHDHPSAPAWLPGALAVLIDGAIVQAAIFNSVTPIADARVAAARLLEGRS